MGGTGGVVASSDPRAARAAADVLREGGNAVDAAVAAVLVLFVVEPNGCGPGGDAFLLYSEPGREPQGLDGSGAIPAGLTAEALSADGRDGVPGRGPGSVTVPGAIDLLEDALRRFGTRTISELAGPAIGLARNGFEVSKRLAKKCASSAKEIAGDPVLGPLYVPNGRPVEEGQTLVNPLLAACLGAIGEGGADALYRGPIGERIVERVRAAGGYLSVDDMRAHRTVAVDPISTTFRGARVYELPYPTQGPAVLRALDLIEPHDEIDWEKVLEAIASGLLDVGINVRVDHSVKRAATPRGTSYLAVIDGEGRGASMIASVFADFGAQIGVEALGGPLHNRAGGLRVTHGGEPQTGKPTHTLIPSIVTRDGELESLVGLAGGYVQAQIQVQLLIHLLHKGMEPQEAVDAPRMRWLFGGEIALEPGHPLADRHPDAVGRPTGPEEYGGAQIASRRGGRLSAGADRRRGGAVVTV